MKKFLVWLLVLIALAAILIRFSDQLAEVIFGVKKTSGISVTSVPPEATVFLDNKEVGKTPYEEKNLDVKDYLLKIDKAGATWQGRVKLIAGTITVVNRDIASDSASSAGEILTLEKGKGLTIISSPSDSDIEIDGKLAGKTPVSISAAAGDHMIVVSHTGYFKRSIQARLPDNYNMTVSIDLALSEVDLTVIQTPVTTVTPELLVKNTPTGFLRVRDKASLSGREIARVKPGDMLILLEELGSWDRVRLPNNTEGFVSAAYVSKKTP